MSERPNVQLYEAMVKLNFIHTTLTTMLGEHQDNAFCDGMALCFSEIEAQIEHVYGVLCQQNIINSTNLGAEIAETAETLTKQGQVKVLEFILDLQAVENVTRKKEDEQALANPLNF